MSSQTWRLGVLVCVGLLACWGPVFQKPRPSSERVNHAIPTDRFHILATIAGGDSRTELRMSAGVRQQLEEAGFTVVRRSGRWESLVDAAREICAPGGEEVPPDGVLFVWYNRLQLHDCVTAGSAYEITSGGQEGITQLTDRLIRYLKQGGQAPAPPSN